MEPMRVRRWPWSEWISREFWLRNRTLGDLGIVAAENALQKLLNFVLFVIVARRLGPDAFGLFSFAITSIVFLNVLMDLSMENSVIRFSGQYPETRDYFFGLYLLLKLGTTAVLLVTAVLAGPALAVLFKKPEIVNIGWVIAVGCGIEGIRAVSLTYWQSQEAFLPRATLNVGAALVRLVAVAGLLWFAGNDPRLLSLAFALSGLVVVLPFGGQLWRMLDALRRIRLSRECWREIRHYSQWLATGALAWNLMSRLDFYLVTALFSFEAAGWYSAGGTLAAALGVLQLIFNKVLMPKVSRYTCWDQLDRYLRKATLCGIVVTGACLLLLLAGHELIRLALGPEYLPAVGVFRILLLSSLCTFWNSLYALPFYTLGRTKQVTVGAYLQIFIFLACLFPWRQWQGATGVAWARLTSDLLFLAYVVCALYRLRRECHVPREAFS